MYRPLIKFGLIVAIAHFGLLVLAIRASFTIFTGPSTAGEVFWDHVVGVLLFPGSLLFQVMADDLSRAVIWGLNSLLWGFILAYCYLAWRKVRAK